MPSFFKKSSGFTLIELLVVISIIGILASLSMVSYTSTQRQARDAERQNDIKQYQSLLTSYASRNKGFYPNQTLVSDADNQCGAVGATNCPLDPKDPAQTYKYCSNTANSSYAVWATLESASSTTYFVICGNGKVGNSTTVPGCGGSFSCPL